MKPAPVHVADIRGWGHLQYRPDGEAMQDGNAERIVSCVNKCAGIQDLSSAVLVPAETMKEASAALEENMLQLKAAWQFLDALCKNDCSRDRMAARDRALAGYQFALKNFRILSRLITQTQSQGKE